MKTVLIIGMGRFGHHLASNMISLGNEVMIVGWRSRRTSSTRSPT